MMYFPLMKTDCPIADCNYNERMREYDAALARPLILKTTRSNESTDAHRDMDGFDVDEELARLRRAIKEANSGDLTTHCFIAEAFSNIDEHLRRLGRLPHAWG